LYELDADGLVPNAVVESLTVGCHSDWPNEAFVDVDGRRLPLLILGFQVEEWSEIRGDDAPEEPEGFRFNADGSLRLRMDEIK
jgi:hypothetical protein